MNFMAETITEEHRQVLTVIMTLAMGLLCGLPIGFIVGISTSSKREK